MAHKIVMPKAGMAMEKGTIVAWLKNVGDEISYGEPLLEIETDKTTMQVESLNEGFLLSKLYDEGAEVPVVTTIGYIGERGEAAPQADTAPAEPQGCTNGEAVPQDNGASAAPPADESLPEKTQDGAKIPATPAARRLAKERGIKLEDIATGGVLHAADVPDSHGVLASPLAKRIAQAQDIDLRGVRGSGHAGKVMSADIAGQAAPASPPIVPQKADTLIKLSGMRKTIARRMLQSHAEIPPVTLHSEADVTALAKLRGEINSIQGVKVSFNDLVIKACALALCEFPEINASYTDDGIQRHGGINIGVAVAVEDGLKVPVIKDADTLSLRALSAKAKELAEKTRDGSLPLSGFTGGTFTISNLGMFGVTAFTPIINLPEACILGVCSIKERVCLCSGGVESRKYMGLSLTFDHRCIDGAGGAKFLRRVAELLENPWEMIE